MGLDWYAPPYFKDDPAGPSAPALPTLKVDVDSGQLRSVIERNFSHREQTEVPAVDLVARYTERLNAHPDDPEALHQRGHALLRLVRFDQALADFSAACSLRQLDSHLRAYRGVCLFYLKRYAAALDELESAFRADPETVRAIQNLERGVSRLAWALVMGPKPERNPELAARLAAFSAAHRSG